MMVTSLYCVYRKNRGNLGSPLPPSFIACLCYLGTKYMEVNHFFDKGFIAADLTEDIISNLTTISSLGGSETTELELEEDYKDILRENLNYSRQYKDLMRDEGNQLDAIHYYKRSWMQTINLVVASIVLGVFIYRQK